MLNQTGDVLAIDAGGTKIHLALFRNARKLLEYRFETSACYGSRACVDEIIGAGQELVHKADASLRAIGLASPGVVDPTSKKTSHTWNIEGWDETPVASLIENAFSVPVSVENDANLAAYGSLVFENPGDSFVFMAVGTGFGAGLILNRKIWSGKKGGAGEIARLVMDKSALSETFDYGHLESMMSGSGFEKRYQYVTGQSITGSEIARRVKVGDQVAKDILEDGAKYLGMAAANVSTLLDLDAVVLGGGVIVKDKDRWLDSVHQVIEKFCLFPPKVLCSSLGDEAVLLGACALAYQTERMR